ncbi:MAG: amidase family protein, partial [Rhodococcus sp. (in: high G+C Gram-positive bacteria)]
TYMSGVDEADPTTRASPDVKFPLAPSGRPRALADMRVGVPSDAFDNLPTSIGSLMTTAIDTAKSLGVEVVTDVMPTLPSSLLMGDRCEMGAYHQQFVDRLDKYRTSSAIAVGFGSAALVTPVADYISFEHDRLRYQRDFNRMFADNSLDAILIPGAVTDGIDRDAAAELGVLDNPIADVRWANYTGSPVATIPVGRSAETGLPFGVQIGGLPWNDRKVIEIGLEMQSLLGTWQELPDIRPAPRDIPGVGLTNPGPGPDPTNTRRASAPLGTLPTTATHPA